jgi:hypothetical protein
VLWLQYVSHSIGRRKLKRALMDFIFYRVVGDLALVVTSDCSDGKCGKSGRESPTDVYA